MTVREGFYSEEIRNRSFEEILDHLGKIQKQVYDVIELLEPCSNEEIAKHLNKYPNCITPRVKELRELGLVEFCQKGKSKTTKKKVSLWKIIRPESQTEMKL